MAFPIYLMPAWKAEVEIEVKVKVEVEVKGMVKKKGCKNTP
jgi:hypothetical protein